MTLNSRFARSLVLATVTISTLALSPVASASAGAIPDPYTQYQVTSYHYGSIRGEVIGQYAHAGPCGEAFWWGETSGYTTTSWVTCP
ncbi:MAG TPA: hypothetical protein VGB75_17295 [Jatrophihabitans sp.]|jgi:hypothetical protein|uniref:hypothetical protein n=1 Tax=Jatrophihabitans sp. TaxID=1932789 RepID=UPI002F1CFCA3